ncbi:hypothetical protein VCHA53O466_50272 [Vibrio chagasii]|nr:hypothetical protein VCHA53O466_50272 [Vibrio chagasii]
MEITRCSKHGFMLIEALLASALIGAVVLGKVQLDAREDAKINKQNFGREISELLTAFDRRILLDGLLMEANGEWEASESDTYNSVGWLMEELIARENPDCGQSSGWSPSNSQNSEVALISCNHLNKNGLPFGLTMSTERFGLDNDPRLFKEWSVVLKPNDAASFEPNVLFTILESAKRHSTTRVMGVHRYRLIDYRSGIELKPSDCIAVGENCAIKATFESNHAGLSEDPHLRVDGSNIMRNSINFSTSAMPATCYRNSFEGGEVTRNDVACGINLDSDGASGESLTVDANTLSAQSILLSDSHGASRAGTAAVTCTDKEGGSTICGITSISEANSVAARAYINSIIVDDFIRLSKSGETQFEVDVAGNISNRGTLSTKGHAHLMGGLTVNGGIATINDGLKVTGGSDVEAITVREKGEFKKAVDVYGIFEAKGDFFARGKSTLANTDITGKLDAKGDASVSGLLTAKGNFRMDKVVNTSSDGCSTAENGDFARDQTGGMAQCQANKWVTTASPTPVVREPKTTGTFNYPASTSGLSMVNVEYNNYSSTALNPLKGATRNITVPRNIVLSTSNGCSISYTNNCNIRIGTTFASGCPAFTTSVKKPYRYYTGSSYICGTSGTQSITYPPITIDRLTFF